MGNIVKKRDTVVLSPILNAFSSIIYVTKKLTSEENEQDNKIQEQVKKIKKQEDSSYIDELEKSTNSSNDTRKRKISVGKVENAKKIQSTKVKINKEYDEERERRI